MADISAFGAAERASAAVLAGVAQGLERFQKQALSTLLEERGRKAATEAVLEGRFGEERARITEYDVAFDDVVTADAQAQLRDPGRPVRWRDPLAA